MQPLQTLSSCYVIHKIMQTSFLLEQRLSEQEIKNLNQIPHLVNDFVKGYPGKTITMLTSGGTSVPLEKRAVRFLQNFSTGFRGSLLAEALLKRDQPVIFFYRQNSYLPFSRGLTVNSLFLDEQEKNFKAFLQGLQSMNKYKPLLLLLPFRSIYYYLNGIKIIRESLPKHSRMIMCAAVSDFIPKEVSAHKIHTAEHLSLQLISSPKMLGQVASEDHLCASFKLETDQGKLQERVEFALQKYGIDMVVGNCLLEKNWVKISYNPNTLSQKQSVLFQSQVQGQVEDFIVQKVIEAHKTKFDSK